MKTLENIEDREQSSHTPVIAIRHQGMVSKWMLILSNTIQLVMINNHTNFIILSQVLSEKSLTEKFPYALHRSERWEQGKWKKKAKIITSILNFFSTIYLAIHKADTKIKKPGSIRN